MGKFFTKTIKPQFTATTIIQSNKTHLAFAAGDVMVDWTAINMPKGASKLIDVTAVIKGQDGVAQTARDLVLYFAKATEAGAAPGSLGTVNATANGFGYFNQLIGTALVDSSDFKIGLDYLSMASNGHGAASNQIPGVVLQPAESTSVTDTIYLGVIAGGSADFSFETGVQTTEAVSASTSAVTLTVDGTDARKCFDVGDVVGAMDDAAIGTVTNIASGTEFTVDAVGGALADDDEIVNLTPLTIILSFER